MLRAEKMRVEAEERRSERLAEEALELSSPR
jgi:hypothetical protein